MPTPELLTTKNGAYVKTPDGKLQLVTYQAKLNGKHVIFTKDATYHEDELSTAKGAGAGEQ